MCEIVCLTRGTSRKLQDLQWRSAVETAVSTPLQVIKDGNTLKKTVKTVLRPWGEVCLHTFGWSFKDRIRVVLGSPSKRPVWDHGLALLEREISIPEPLIYIEVKKGSFFRQTYLATRWLEGDNLASVATGGGSDSEDQVLPILERAAALAASFHDAGFVHGDMKWSNFLQVDGPYGKIYLSDLDHVQSSESPRNQGKDLARFALSAVECGLGWGVADHLIEWYFHSRKTYPLKLKKYFYKRVEKKRKKYENRSPEDRNREDGFNDD